MKIKKYAEYDYDGYAINEKNGYVKWCDIKAIEKKLLLPARYSQIFMWFALFICTKLFRSDIKNTEIPVLICWVVLNAAVSLAVNMFLHGILQLFVLSKGRLDSKCVLVLRKGTSLYNENITRNQILISLIFPLIILIPAFSAAAILTSKMLRLFFLFQLIIFCFTCVKNIYLFFYCFKHIEKNDIVFGEYKKSKQPI